MDVLEDEKPSCPQMPNPLSFSALITMASYAVACRKNGWMLKLNARSTEKFIINS